MNRRLISVFVQPLFTTLCTKVYQTAMLRLFFFYVTINMRAVNVKICVHDISHLLFYGLILHERYMLLLLLLLMFSHFGVSV